MTYSFGFGTSWRSFVELFTRLGPRAAGYIERIFCSLRSDYNSLTCQIRRSQHMWLAAMIISSRLLLCNHGPQMRKDTGCFDQEKQNACCSIEASALGRGWFWQPHSVWNLQTNSKDVECDRPARGQWTTAGLSNCRVRPLWQPRAHQACWMTGIIQVRDNLV